MHIFSPIVPRKGGGSASFENNYINILSYSSSGLENPTVF